MLISRPTKYGAGIALAGDFADLFNLRKTIHYLASETGSIPIEHQGFVQEILAYEIRKAYEGQRRVELVDTLHDPVNYYATDILWPVFLVQIAMLRTAASYLPTNRIHQANLYRIEACAEGALLEMEPAIGALCMRWLSCYTPLPSSFLMAFVSDRTRDFLFGAKDNTCHLRI